MTYSKLPRKYKGVTVYKCDHCRTQLVFLDNEPPARVDSCLKFHESRCRLAKPRSKK